MLREIPRQDSSIVLRQVVLDVTGKYGRFDELEHGQSHFRAICVYGSAVVNNKSGHRQLEPLLLRTSLRDLIPRIRMPHHAGGRVVPQHPRDALVGGFGAVADDDNAAVLRIAHPYPAARSAERRVGKEGVSTVSSRWLPYQ